MAQLPGGTVTFLFTDIEGSTRLRASGHEVFSPVETEEPTAILSMSV